MEYDVYFDESGDLGTFFDKPYRKGGSSTYFTIAYIIIPIDKNKIINRFVKRFQKIRQSENEIKGANLKKGRAKKLSNEIGKLIDLHPDIIVGAITSNKKNAPKPLLKEKNVELLYSYMVQKSICDRISSFDKVRIVPDERSIPAGSQNSCADLIKTDLWFWKKVETEISYKQEESFRNERLMFIDWVANFVWRHYENGHSDPYRILGKYIEDETLFF